MKKKTIVHITSSLQQGGAETLLAGLLQQLSDYDHHVLYFYDGPFRAIIEKQGIKTSCVKGFFVTSDPTCIVKIMRHLLIVKPTIIHSMLWLASFYGRIAAFFLRIPIICAVHIHVAHHGWLRNTLDHLMPINPKHYIAVSKSVAQSMQSHIKIKPTQIVTIANGIDHTAIHARSLSLQEQARTHISMILNKSCKPFVIGCVGRFVEAKQQSLLIASFAELCKTYSHIELVLIGLGPLESALRKQVQELGIGERVMFLINKPAVAHYPFFDCFVQPSLHEGLSLALLEAMSFGLPVIVTGENGFHDVVTDGETGFVIESRNSVELQKAMQKLIENPELCSMLSINARNVSQQEYTFSKMAEQYHRIFQSF